MPNGVETYKNQIRQKIQEYLDTLCKAWGDAIKSHQITYAVTVYASRFLKQGTCEAGAVFFAS